MSDLKSSIAALEVKINQAELKLEAPETGGNPEEANHLRKSIQQLREEKLLLLEQEVLTMRDSGLQLLSLHTS